jgi:hypothetical protein
MSRKLLIGLGIVLAAASALAQERTPARVPRPSATPNTVSIMNQRVPELTFEDLPLQQVMDWLAEFTKLNISVRWQTLADAGVDRDKPISIQARNLRLSQVLWLIMAEAAGSELKLAYRASGNLLILSTADDLDKEMVTKIYDVADLLTRLPRALRQGAFNVTQGLGQSGGQGGGGGGGGAGGGMFGQGQGQQQQQQGAQGAYGAAGGAGGPDAQLKELVELIRQTVEPDTWRENGGQGSIIPFQTSIVVRNTILVHQRLGGYLSEADVLGQ